MSSGGWEFRDVEKLHISKNSCLISKIKNDAKMALLDAKVEDQEMA